MPFPLNQMTNRLWIELLVAFGGVSAAYAVPVELNMEISGGTPTTTGTWAAVSPLRKILRDKRMRLVITCDTDLPPRVCKFPRFNQCHHQFPEVKTGVPKPLRRGAEHWPVGWRVQASGHIPEDLFDHALLTLRALRKKGAEFPGTRELRGLDSGNKAFGIQVEFHFLWLGAARCDAGQVRIEH